MRVLGIGIEFYLKQNIIKLNLRNNKFDFINSNEIKGVNLIYNFEKFNNYDVLLVGVDYNQSCDFSSNCELLTNIICMISKCENIKKVIFLSNYSVYKEKENDTIYNEEDMIEPQDYKSSICYYYESMLRCTCMKIHKKLIILRLFNTFGLYQNNDFIITYLVSEMLKNTSDLLIGDIRKKEIIYI